MDELTAWLESQRATATDDFALGAPVFLAMLRADRTRRHSARGARAGRPQGSGTQSRRAQGGLRSLCAQSEPCGLRRQDARQQAFGRQCRGRARAARGAAPVRDRQEAGFHSEPGAGAGGRIAALQPRQFRLHQHSRAVRESGGEGDVLRRPTGRRSGAPPSATPIFPARPTCCSYRRTKCGRATTSSRSS